MDRLRRLAHAAVARPSVLAAAVALGAALALKRYYAHASPGDLRFVLGPSCWLAARISGLHFEWDAAAGFVSHDARMVVGPACAGVNFLTVCALALYFAVQGAAPRLRDKLGALAASAALAYPATLMANGSRIALAAWLGRRDFGAHLSHASAHRLLGVVVYSAALLSCCALATRVLPLATGSGTSRRYLLPLGCYLGVALVLPLCRRAFTTGPAGFAEHALQTLAAASAVVLAAFVCERLLDRLSSGRARSMGGARGSRWASRES